jgi:hypothetical protein
MGDEPRDINVIIHDLLSLAQEHNERYESEKEKRQHTEERCLILEQKLDKYSIVLNPI